MNANARFDQCVARADRRRASFDQRAEEQQIAGAAIDVFDIEPLLRLTPSGPSTTYSRPRISDTYARSLQDVLRGYRLEYSEVARRPLGTHTKT